MDLSVIVVSWNVKEKLESNLQALYLSEGDFEFEVFVIDNASTDDSVQMIREKFPQVHLISNENNLGFAQANNQAIALAQGNFILLLNPDMQVLPHTLNDILIWAQANPQASVSSCQLLDKEKNNLPHVRRFPKFFDQLMITIKIPHLFPQVLNKYLMKNFDYGKAQAVDSVRGSFFLINRQNYFNLGLGRYPFLDERYFLWFEEVDFCRNIYHNGGEVWYTPAAQCADYLGQSFAQVNRGQTQIYFRDSMLQYFKKWERKWQTQVLGLAWRLVFLFIKK